MALSTAASTAASGDHDEAGETEARDRRRSITSVAVDQGVEVGDNGRQAYLSYKWTGESERVANELDAELTTRGIPLVRDTRAVKYRDSIRTFMQEMGTATAVVVIIGHDYLRSKYCMYELLEIADNDDFRDRVFPVVLADAGIFDGVGVISHVKHWEDEKAKLDAAIKSVSGEHLQGVREELDDLDEIRDRIARITDVLSDMNVLTPEQHERSGFADLAAALESRLAEAVDSSAPTSPLPPPPPPTSNPAAGAADPAIMEMSAYVNAIMQSVVHAGVDSFAIFEIRHTTRYVQVAARRDGLTAEVSSNLFLEGDDRWSDAELERLAALGWSEPVDDDDPNHSIEFTGLLGVDPGPLIELFSRSIATTLVDVLGVTSPGAIRLETADFAADGEDVEIEDGLEIDLSRMTENQQYLLRDALPNGVPRTWDGDVLVVDGAYEALVERAFSDARFATLSIGDESPHDPYDTGEYHEFPDSSTDEQVALAMRLLDAGVRYYWVTDTGLMVHPDDASEGDRVLGSLHG